MRTALITGGSGGIGLALARVMAAKGHNLVLTSRTKKKLEEAKRDLEKEYDVEVSIIVSDLSEPGSAKKLFNDAKKHKIGIVVNNAGMGYVEDFLESDISRNIAMMQLNMGSLVELCHMYGNYFAENDGGRILNVASVAAFVPGPNQPVYYASKAFVRSFSRALSEKLSDRDISVTVLNPGATKTDFFKSADAGFYTQGVSAESVAKDGYRAMMQGKSEITSGFSNKVLASFVARAIPYNVQARVVSNLGDI